MLSLMYPLLTLLILITPQVITADARELTSMKEFREILSEKKPVCIMFYAPWCSACKTMKEPFNAAAQVLKKDVLFVKVDADNEKFKVAADSFGIEAIPTLVFKHVGALTKDQLVTAIKGFVSPTKSIKETPKKAIEKKPALKKTQGPAKKQQQSGQKKAQIPAKKPARIA